MEGILFQPIPLETTYFTINVGVQEQTSQPNQENNEGGGCLLDRKSTRLNSSHW